MIIVYIYIIASYLYAIYLTNEAMKKKQPKEEYYYLGFFLLLAPLTMFFHLMFQIWIRKK